MHETEAVGVGVDPDVRNVVRQREPRAGLEEREAVISEAGRGIFGAQRLSAEDLRARRGAVPGSQFVGHTLSPQGTGTGSDLRPRRGASVAGGQHWAAAGLGGPRYGTRLRRAGRLDPHGAGRAGARLGRGGHRRRRRRAGRSRNRERRGGGAVRVRPRSVRSAHREPADLREPVEAVGGRRNLVGRMAQHVSDATLLIAFDQHLPAGQPGLLPVP